MLRMFLAVFSKQQRTTSAMETALILKKGESLERCSFHAGETFQFFANADWKMWDITTIKFWAFETKWIQNS